MCNNAGVKTELFKVVVSVTILSIIDSKWCHQPHCSDKLPTTQIHLRVEKFPRGFWFFWSTHLFSLCLLSLNSTAAPSHYRSLNSLYIYISAGNTWFSNLFLFSFGFLELSTHTLIRTQPSMRKEEPVSTNSQQLLNVLLLMPLSVSTSSIILQLLILQLLNILLLSYMR